MDSTRFDRISKAFATRRISRRQTLATGAAGFAAGTIAVAGVNHTSVAQDTTSEPAIDTPAPDADHGPTMLFVQTYQAGKITPVEGETGATP